MTTTSAGRRRIARLGAAAAAATALCACSGGQSVPFATAPVQTPTTATHSVGPVAMTISDASTTLPDGSTAKYVTIGVTGGAPSVATRIRLSANKLVESEVDAFAARASAARGVPATSKTLTVEGRTQQWKGYFTLRLTAREQVGDRRRTTSVAYLWSAADGKRITAGDLFADPAAVTVAVRRAFDAARPGRSAAWARLSLAADAEGRTAPLSCVPVTAGLECAVDSGTAATAATDLLTSTVPWSSIESRLRTDLEG